MCQFPNKEKLAELRKKFPAGARIRLLKMEDIQAVPPGTIGTVEFVDDAGTVFVTWETGSSLGLIPEIDEYEILD